MRAHRFGPLLCGQVRPVDRLGTGRGGLYVPLLSRLGRKDARHQVVLSIFRGVFVDGATRTLKGLRSTQRRRGGYLVRS